MGWGGSEFFLAERQSRLYPHMRAQFGRDPTAVSKKLPFNFIRRCVFNVVNPPLPEIVLPHEGDRYRLCHGEQYRIEQQTPGQSNVYHNNCVDQVRIKGGRILSVDALGELHDMFYESRSFG